MMRYTLAEESMVGRFQLSRVLKSPRITNTMITPRQIAKWMVWIVFNFSFILEQIRVIYLEASFFTFPIQRFGNYVRDNLNPFIS